MALSNISVTMKKYIIRITCGLVLLVNIIVFLIVIRISATSYDELVDAIKMLGGSKAFISACLELQDELVESEYLMNLPKDSIVKHLNPQFVHLIRNSYGMFINVQVSGGFQHKGYIVVVNWTGSERILPVRFSKWEVSPMLYVYEERLHWIVQLNQARFP